MAAHQLPHPWDSPGKNTGVGCHVLLQCMKVKSESEVAQPHPTPSNPMDCSLPGSSIHGIFQARVLDWGAIAFSARLITAILRAAVPPSSRAQSQGCALMELACWFAAHPSCQARSLLLHSLYQLMFTLPAHVPSRLLGDEQRRTQARLLGLWFQL